MLAVEAVAALFNAKAYKGIHLGFVTLIAAFFAVQLLKRISAVAGWPTLLLILAALALGGLVAYGLVRSAFVRNLMDVLTVAPLVILGLFVFASDASRLILPQEDAEALGGRIAKDTPVVMVILDELPTATLLDEAGEIDGKRFPAFAKLAQKSTWYPNNTTVADFTGRAVPAIMTGINPGGEKLPIAADQPRSIFTLLGDNYDLHVHETVTQICPESLCGESEVENVRQLVRLRDLFRDLRYVEGRLVLPPGLANKLPNVSTTFGDFGNNAATAGGDDPKAAGKFVRDLFVPPSPEELEGFVDEIPEGGRTLSLIHMEVPHEPFRFLATGRTYNNTEVSNLNSPGAQSWVVGKAGVATVEQRHYIQSAYADRLIGTVVRRLEQLGIWDEAMVVVTADHGISFRPGEPRRIAVESNMGGIINPPLFIKYPGQEQSEVSEQHTRTIDVVPTIAEELGVRDMYETDGRPISEDAAGDEVVVRNGFTDVVTFKVEDMIRDRERVVAESVAELGNGGLNRLGPAPSLIGREVGPASGDQAELADASIFDDVDLDRDPLPAFITGNLNGVEPREVIAVAVNGRIVGTTRAFEYEGSMRFAVLAPETALISGRNQVSIFSVATRGDAAPGADAQLTPLGGN